MHHACTRTPAFARHSPASRGEVNAISLTRNGPLTRSRWNFDSLPFRGCYMKNKFVARLSHLSFGSGRCIQNFNIVIPSPRRYIAACTYRAILYFGSFPEDIVPLTASKDASISPNVFQEVAAINLWNGKEGRKRGANLSFHHFNKTYDNCISPGVEKGKDHDGNGRNRPCF